MPTKILLINPWIYDFAAFNLWARPLGLLKVAEFLSSYDVNLKLIDCTEEYSQKRFHTGKYKRTPVEKPYVLKDIPRQFCRYGIDVNRFISEVKRFLPLDAVFITSIMTYWYVGVKRVAEIVRELSPKSKIIVGGIYARLCPDHAFKTIEADYFHPCRIDELSCNIPVISQLKQRSESVPYYKLGLYQRLHYGALLTSHGCPFSCTYCASGLLGESFFQRPYEEVFKEIRELYKAGVRDFAFYDDALLINAERHIKPLLRKITEEGLSLRFHCPNALHAAYIDSELAYLMRKTNFATVRLSLETVNEARQRFTGGKINSDGFQRAVEHLKREGFTKKQLGAYLMYGLPGQSLDEVHEGVDFLKTLDIGINLTEFSPIHGTMSFKTLVSSGVISNDIDPLLTNNSVFSYLYCGYSSDEIEKLKLNVREHN